MVSCILPFWHEVPSLLVSEFCQHLSFGYHNLTSIPSKWKKKIRYTDNNQNFALFHQSNHFDLIEYSKGTDQPVLMCSLVSTLFYSSKEQITRLSTYLI